MRKGPSAAIWDRWDATVEVSREHQDFFIKNMVAILCEEKLADRVPNRWHRARQFWQLRLFVIEESPIERGNSFLKEAGPGEVRFAGPEFVSMLDFPFVQASSIAAFPGTILSWPQLSIVCRLVVEICRDSLVLVHIIFSRKERAAVGTLGAEQRLKPPRLQRRRNGHRKISIRSA